MGWLTFASMGSSIYVSETDAPTEARQKIILSAIEVFNQQGYGGTTMATLGQACGLSKGSFYHHFATKEALLEACIAFAGDYIGSRIFNQAYRSEVPIAERIDTMFRRLVRVSTHNYQGCFFGNLASETAHLQTTFRERLQHYFVVFQDAMAHLLTEQGLPEATAQACAQECLCLYEGAALVTKLTRNPQPLERARLLIAEKLLVQG